jgi:phosphoketolase
MNRAIRERDLDSIFITGPGHGGPALVASTKLEGSYSEIYPHVSRDGEGMQQMADERLRHRAYTREHGDDPDDVRGWIWLG